MIKSMTGYGSFESENDQAQIFVEIKSLNSRFFDFYSKSGKALSIYDEEVKSKIKDACLRGNFQLKVKIIFFKNPKLDIDRSKIEEYLSIGEQIFNMKGNVDLSPLSIDKLMSMPDIYKVTDLGSSNISIVKDLYFKCVDGAIKELNKSRFLEGEKLQNAIDENLDNLYKGLKLIIKLHKNDNDNEFSSYRDKIVKILGDIDLNESRLYQEVAIIIDKHDISEELVRLDSHLGVLKSYLSERMEVGKKINFILQEIGREINTITSKSSNIKITHEILNMKNEVEQIREQTQNIL
tara:strand:- start:2412 stop:3293 length:882 start_codon:yes stop_codon:yes gene_type:complete